MLQTILLSCCFPFLIVKEHCPLTSFVSDLNKIMVHEGKPTIVKSIFAVLNVNVINAALGIMIGMALYDWIDKLMSGILFSVFNNENNTNRIFVNSKEIWYSLVTQMAILSCVLILLIIVVFLYKFFFEKIKNKSNMYDV